MKSFSNEAKKISIVFVCDACGEDTPVETIEVPVDGEIVVNAVCPACFKEFDVKIVHKNGSSWVEIPDVNDDEITITIVE